MIAEAHYGYHARQIQFDSVREKRDSFISRWFVDEATRISRQEFPIESDGSNRPSTRIQRAWPYLAIAVAPVLLFWVYPIPPTVQIGRPTDAFYYTGYINNFDELVRLYGLTYHSVRFGMILPAWAMTRLLGPVAGFYALRYLLTVLALSLYFRCVRRNVGATWAAAGVVLLLATPTWYRIVLWDYVVATAVPYLLIGTSLLFTPQERWLRLRAFAVGAVFALAVDSNAWAFQLVFFACLAGALFSSDRWKRYAVVEIPCIVAGALLAHGAGLAFYYFRFGIWRLDGVTFRTVNRLSANDTVRMGRNDLTWMTEELLIYALPFLLLTVLVAWRSARVSRFCRAACAFGLAAAAFYCYWQFLRPLGGDVLYIPFYRSYLVPCWAMVFPCAAKYVLQDLSERFQKCVVGVLSIITLAIPFFGDSSPFLHWGFTAFALVTTATFAGLWLAPKRSVVKVAFATTWWLLLVVQLYSSSHGEGTDQERKHLHGPEENLNLYRLAVEFKDIVPAAESADEFRFWFANDDMFVFDVQGTFQGGPSMLGSKSATIAGPGMPVLDEKARNALRNPRLKRVILLAAEPHEIDAGLQSLQAEIPGAAPASRTQLTSGRYTLHAAIVALPDVRPRLGP